ncbi:MAG: hypothetical protein JXA57_16040 [Armatimonadetes bacterium]|nr:hypothetical protein [Armatimonadota bacterium]
MMADGLYEYRLIFPEGDVPPLPGFKAPPRMNREPARFKEKGGLAVPELPREDPFKRPDAPAKPTVASAAGTAVSAARAAGEILLLIEKYRQLRPRNVQMLAAGEKALKNAQDACDKRCAGYPCDEWGLWCAGRISNTQTFPDPRYTPVVDAPAPPSAPRISARSGPTQHEDPYFDVHIRVTVAFDCACEPRKTWYRRMLETFEDTATEIPH